MSSGIVTVMLNIWAINIATLPEIVYVNVDSRISPTDIKDIVADKLGWSRSTFTLLMPSQSMKIPNPATNEALQGLQMTPPKNLTLQGLPRVWNAEEVFRDEEDLHLVGIKRGAYKVNIFNTQSRKIISSDAYLENRIDSFCHPAYKPPALIAYDSPDAKKSLISMDLSTLEKIRGGATTLRGLYPLGLPDIIHLINAPEEEDVLLPLNAGDKRQKYFKNVPPKAPSSEAKGTLSPFDQQLVGRLPGSLNAAPPSLFDETLCQLRYDVHYVDPLARDYAAFYKLHTVMIPTYRTEYLRQQALYELVSDFLPSTPLELTVNGYRTDGALLVHYGKQSFIYMLIEIKNEVGLATAEPGVQAARYYVEHLRNVFEGLDHCVFPVILLCQFGPYLSVLVGSASPVPAVEQIACIALHADITNLEEAKAGARIIAALRIASHSLQKKYPSLLEDPDRQVDFPFPRSYTDENGKQVNFTYIRAEEDKRIYYAHLNDTGERICVKFSLRYSPKAHQGASKTGYAPTLLANKHVGDWNMIVMKDESSNYISLYDLKAQMRTSADRIKRIQEEVRKALGILHGQGYVHGDIRDVNVLVRRTSAEAELPLILLVDWDWAGREGKATYPYTLNPEILRPDGATEGAKILPSHDIRMVDYL